MMSRLAMLLLVVAAIACQPETNSGSLSRIDSSGVVFLAHINEDGGRPFYGYLSTGGFVPFPPWSPRDSARLRQLRARAISAFAPGQQFTGIGPGGPIAGVRIDSVNPDADYYEPVLLVTGSAKQSDVPALITTDSSLALTLVPYSDATLDAGVELALGERLRLLWVRALAERDAEDSAATYELGRPAVHAVGAFLTVSYPLVIAWNPEYRDDRGSAFFIYSLREHSIAYSTLGHPEWAPVDESTILTVQPYFYFRVGGDSAIYFLGEHAGGWEDMGMAVFELKSGRALLGGD